MGEGKKQFLLLVNKADFLSEELIVHWNEYFKEKNIKHIFFSALREQTKIDSGDLDVDSEKEAEEEDVVEDTETTTVPLDIEEIKKIEETQGGFKNEFERQEKEEKIAAQCQRKLDVTLDEDLELSTTEVFTRAQLLTYLK